jgi:hypothetical protein
MDTQTESSSASTDNLTIYNDIKTDDTSQVENIDNNATIDNTRIDNSNTDDAYRDCYEAH